MRPYEALLCLLTLYNIYNNTLPYQHHIASANLAVHIKHWLSEGERFLLYPVYAIGAYISIALLLHDNPTLGYTSYTNTSLALIVFSCAMLSYLLPVGKLPPLCGPYKQISCTTKYLSADHIPSLNTKFNIKELDADAQNNPFIAQYNDTKLQLVVKFYYPSAFQRNPALPRLQYTDSRVSAAVARFAKLPAFIFKPITYMRLHSSVDLPCIDTLQKLPVVLFSHGLGGHESIYSVLCENLASYGYIVAVPTHNDHSAAIAQLPNDVVVNHHFLTKAELNSHVAILIRQAQLSRRVREIRFLLDYIAQSEKENLWQQNFTVDNKKLRINQSSTFHIAQRFDLSRIAAAGHSYGGITVCSAAAVDDRIKAVIGHDTWFLPIAKHVAAHGIRQPLLQTVSEHFYKWSENWVVQQKFTAACRQHNSADVDACLVLNGTRHQNPSDVTAWMPSVARLIRAIGTMDATVAYNQLNIVSALWLNERLKLVDGMPSLQNYIEKHSNIKKE